MSDTRTKDFWKHVHWSKKGDFKDGRSSLWLRVELEERSRDLSDSISRKGWISEYLVTTTILHSYGKERYVPLLTKNKKRGIDFSYTALFKWSLLPVPVPFWMYVNTPSATTIMYMHETSSTFQPYRKVQCTSKTCKTHG